MKILNYLQRNPKLVAAPIRLCWVWPHYSTFQRGYFPLQLLIVHPLWEMCLLTYQNLLKSECEPKPCLASVQHCFKLSLNTQWRLCTGPAHIATGGSQVINMWNCPQRATALSVCRFRKQVCPGLVPSDPSAVCFGTPGACHSSSVSNLPGPAESRWPWTSQTSLMILLGDTGKHCQSAAVEGGRRGS